MFWSFNLLYFVHQFLPLLSNVRNWFTAELIICPVTFTFTSFALPCPHPSVYDTIERHPALMAVRSYFRLQPLACTQACSCNNTVTKYVNSPSQNNVSCRGPDVRLVCLQTGHCFPDAWRDLGASRCITDSASSEWRDKLPKIVHWLFVVGCPSPLPHENQKAMPPIPPRRLLSEVFKKGPSHKRMAYCQTCSCKCLTYLT